MVSHGQKEFYFKVKYQIIEDLCCPVEIMKGDGSQISLADYNIEHTSQGGIKGVSNKKYGPVKYIALEMDKACGYVKGSKVIIYTTEYNKLDMLNIVHVHINDMSDEVTIEVEYMGDESSLSEYEEFKADVTG